MNSIPSDLSPLSDDDIASETKKGDHKRRESIKETHAKLTRLCLLWGVPLAGGLVFILLTAWLYFYVTDLNSLPAKERMKEVTETFLSLFKYLAGIISGAFAVYVNKKKP